MPKRTQATRISQYREGSQFSVYGADNVTKFDLIPVIVDADTIQPSHNLRWIEEQKLSTGIPAEGIQPVLCKRRSRQTQP